MTRQHNLLNNSVLRAPKIKYLGHLTAIRISEEGKPKQGSRHVFQDMIALPLMPMGTFDGQLTIL